MAREPNFAQDRTVKVNGVSKFLEEALTIYFQSQQNGGGDVTKVYLPSNGSDFALVEFDSAEIADSILSVKETEGPLKVEKYRKLVDLFPLDREALVSFDSKIEGINFSRKTKDRRFRNTNVRPVFKSNINVKRKTKSRRDIHKECREEQRLRNRRIVCSLNKDGENVKASLRHQSSSFPSDEEASTMLLSDFLKSSGKCEKVVAGTQTQAVMNRNDAVATGDSPGKAERESVFEDEWSHDKFSEKCKKVEADTQTEVMNDAIATGESVGEAGQEKAERESVFEDEWSLKIAKKCKKVEVATQTEVMNDAIATEESAGEAGQETAERESAFEDEWSLKFAKKCEKVVVATQTEAIYNDVIATGESSSKAGQEEVKRLGSAVEDEFAVESNMMRYICNYQWAEFEKLKKVSKEIRVEMKDGSEIVHVIAADQIDEKKFREVTGGFILFYRALHLKMYQEEVKVSGNSNDIDDMISKTSAQFSVILSRTEDGRKCFVYGEKALVTKAAQILKNELTAPQTDQSKGAANKTPLSHRISANVKILVYQGDITKEDAHVIVNPSNERLKHAGGAALAVVKHGGKSIQDECDKIMKQRRKVLQPGEAVITASGKLPCKHVIHAVGPRWNGNEWECRELLRIACSQCLQLASKYGAKSIAIPAMSSGHFGMPSAICAQVLYAVTEYFCLNTPGTLEEIRFVNIDEPTVRVFEREMKKHLKDRGGKVANTSEENQIIAVQTSNKTEDATDQNGLAQSGTDVKDEVVLKPDAAVGEIVNEKALREGFQEPERQTDSGNINMRQAGKVHHQQPPTKPSPIVSPSYQAAGQASNATKSLVGRSDSADCCICLDVMKDPKVLPICKHAFCRTCIDKAFRQRTVCPVCTTVYGTIKGNQPDGTMTSTKQSQRLPGYEKVGSIVIQYSFSPGTQGANHPNPGQSYAGTGRTAYLPDNAEGNKVLGLLRRAFDQRLTFTIGTSVTTGRSNQVVWNDIHHKTSPTGGQMSFGYPDPGYLRRVQDELAAKGIK